MNPRLHLVASQFLAVWRTKLINRPEGGTILKKFMVLYMAPVAALTQTMSATPAQMKASMAEWQKWGDKNKKSIVDMGAPLGKTKRVTPAGASDAKNELGGYTIVQGESLDAVSKIFAGHPHFKMTKDAKIEIVEIMPMPGM